MINMKLLINNSQQTFRVKNIVIDSLWPYKLLFLPKYYIVNVNKYLLNMIIEFRR